MLRLVHPAREGQDPPKRRKGTKPASLFLTADEARHLRAALNNVARAYGGRDVLASVMGLPKSTLKHAAANRRPLSGMLAIRLAKVAGVSVEAILTGNMADVSRCPTCGPKPGSGRLVAGAAS